MEDGCFDDEDLINDYIMEDADEMPPDEYYDQAMYAEMEENNDKQKITPQTNQEGRGQVALINDANGTNNDNGEGDLRMAEETAAPALTSDLPAEKEHNRRLPPQEIFTTSSSNVGSKEKEDHLYNFERYQGGLEWRKTKKTDANTMAVKEWKQQNLASLEKAKAKLWTDSSKGGEGGGIQRKFASSPENQLVEFLKRNHGHDSSTTSLFRVDKTNFIPIEGQHSLPMTLADGTMLHVKSDSSTAEQHPQEMFLSDKSGPILGVPMSELMRRSDIIRRRSERRKRIRGGAVASSTAATPDDSSAPGTRNTAEEDQSHSINEVETGKRKSRNAEKHQLWVDKHAPTIFSHLLSDERTNREVLRALKAWDPYVFRRAAPRRPVMMQSKFLPSSPPKKKNQTSETTAKNDADRADGETSNDLRPDESNRVILLSGPPGVGKTTMAHIVARHAGYRPLEVNGSDERSASVLKDRVLRAMESATLNISSKKDDGPTGRPNCLILDEIDGADAKGAVSALVEIIRADIPAKGTKAKHKNPYLRRPIIFICNHKYAPALRPLLPFAKQFDVTAPSANRLVARLRAVLSAEKLSMMSGSSLLNQLVVGTGGDIRSCLYTLQFASARAREIAKKKSLERGESINTDNLVVDISQPLGSSLGHRGNGIKDERNDAASTVIAVFRKLKKRSVPQGRSGATVLDRKTRCTERVLRLVESFGDNSKTLDCIFTNLLQVSYVDPTLDRCSAAHEWLSSADMYRSNKTSISSNNTMEHHALQRFHMPAAAAAVHLLCRVETKADLTFSTRKLSDLRYQLEANDSLVQKFVEGLSPKARMGAIGSNVVTQSIPYSLWMLSAGEGNCSLNRAVSSLEVMNGNERIAFNEHVRTLRSLGLTYVATEDPEYSQIDRGPQTAQMRLEPYINKLVEFEDLSLEGTKQRKPIPPVLKELLAHAAAIEGMRERDLEAASAKKSAEANGDDRNHLSTSDHNADNLRNKFNKPVYGKENKRLNPHNFAKSTKKSKASTIVASNFLGIGAAKAKAARTARKAAMVGFDRSSKKAKLSNSGSGVPFNQVIRFRYQKGFTQAVRTPVISKDIF